MQVSIAEPKFRPVTVVLETQDELDQLGDEVEVPPGLAPTA